MAFGLAEFSCQKGFDKVPSHHGSHDAASETNDVHVIVLDALPSREVVVDQTGAYSRNFVGANRSTYPASANSNPAIYCAGGDCAGQGSHEVRVVVAWLKTLCTEVNNVMTGSPETATKVLFQSISAVIRGDSDAHIHSLLLGGLWGD
jgi:hypothetical protein